MRINVLTLCDAGSVRESLIGLLGAGVTLFEPSAYPAPLQSFLALQLSASSDERGAHTVNLSILNAMTESSETLMNGTLELNINDTNRSPGGSFQTFSIVLSLAEVLIPEPGDFIIRASVDGGEPLEYGFSSSEPSTTIAAPA